MLKRILAVSALGFAMALSACDEGPEEQAEVAPVEEQGAVVEREGVIVEEEGAATDRPTLEEEGVEVLEGEGEPAER